MGRFPRRAGLSCASRSPLAAAVEAVERRLFLSATSAGVARTALSDKIGGDLAAVYQTYKAGATTAAAAAARVDGAVQVAGNGVQVEAFANPGKAAAVAKGIKKLGGTGIAAGTVEVDATVPVGELAALAKVAGLRYARQTADVTAAGSVTSQGDAASGAAAARSAAGVTGAGVTVGIISDSFDTSAATTDRYATDVATGDLPAGVQVLSDGTSPATNTDEGRAIAQVVYDSAPGASLAFAAAGSGQQAMANGIKSLQAAGAKVIVDDVTFTDEPMFEDGLVAQAVDAAAAAGVTYVAAAGNNGEADYASAWRSGTALTATQYANVAAGAPQFYGGTPFAFNVAGAASPNYQPFTLGPGQSVRLSVQWDSPYFSANGGIGSQNSVDAYVLSADGSQIVAGAVNQDVNGDPVQLVTYTNNTAATATYNLMLVNEVGAVPGYVKYVDFGGQAKFAGVSDGGTIFGHANASAVNLATGASTPTTITVGAANYAQTPANGVMPPVAESTTGEGGTPIFYSSNGTRLPAASYHQEPAVVGVDNVDDTFFGTDTDHDGSPNFVGTSAAAANVAGIAALLLQRSPTLTPAQVASTLESTALDMGAAGVDAQTGYGLVRANAAVGTLTGSITGTVYQDNDGSATLSTGDVGLGGQTVYLDANNNGLLDAGEVSTTTAANGTYTLANLSTTAAATDVVRVVNPTGYVPTAGKQTVAVTGGAATAGTNLGLFPVLYTGTTGSDSYVLQLNPANTAVVQILLGGVVVSSIPKATLTATGAALTFNPGGGNDTLTVNVTTAGLPFTAAGVTYNGGPVATAGGNALVVNGTTGNDTAVVNILNVTFDGGVISNSDVQALTLNMGAGNDSVNVQNAQPATESLTINTGSGTDGVVITNPLPNNGTTTVVNGGTAATDADTLTVDKGTYTFPAGVDPVTTASHLTVVAAGTSTVVFPPSPAGTGVTTRTLAGLTIAAGATVSVGAPLIEGDHAVLVTNTLSVATGTVNSSGGVTTPGGKLALADNALVVQSGTPSAVAGYLANGYNGGTWATAGAAPNITSATAAADTTKTTALGVIQNNAGGSALYGPATPLGLFDGVVAPAAAAVIVKYTYYGDANLDGQLDGSDYARIDAGYLAAGALTGWGNGDFNYDGKIDGSDYTLVDNAFNTQAGGL